MSFLKSAPLLGLNSVAWMQATHPGKPSDMTCNSCSTRGFPVASFGIQNRLTKMPRLSPMNYTNWLTNCVLMPEISSKGTSESFRSCSGARKNTIAVGSRNYMGPTLVTLARSRRLPGADRGPPRHGVRVSSRVWPRDGIPCQRVMRTQLQVRCILKSDPNLGT